MGLIEFARRSRFEGDKNPRGNTVSFIATIEMGNPRARGLPFLVIGGHAVNFYGFARETADLDFLACSDDRPAWITLFGELGYTIFNDAPNFLQLCLGERGCLASGFDVCAANDIQAYV